VSIEAIVGAHRVVPVLSFGSTREAIAVSAALVESGLTLLEITLRTPVALDCIRAVASRFPQASIGAGTVLEPDQLLAAREAGASWGVSPGLTPRLADCIREQGFPFLPGVATVSEAMAARERGFRLLKFFPAESAGGVPFLRALGSVLPDTAFCPTGGIGPQNAAAYLALGNVRAIGGSWMTPRLASGECDIAATKAAALACFSFSPATQAR
jgi:2-dehydro-3-deoxyphosphogluconate aldolase/(4S)-4-hydroxy-2-oxoglutarate aldolase